MIREQLKESLWGRKTVIQLVQVNDAIVTAVNCMSTMKPLYSAA